MRYWRAKRSDRMNGTAACHSCGRSARVGWHQRCHTSGTAPAPAHTSAHSPAVLHASPEPVEAARPATGCASEAESSQPSRSPLALAVPPAPPLAASPPPPKAAPEARPLPDLDELPDDDSGELPAYVLAWLEAPAEALVSALD